LHSVVGKEQLMEKVHQYTAQISWVLLGIGVLALGYIIWRILWK